MLQANPKPNPKPHTITNPNPNPNQVLQLAEERSARDPSRHGSDAQLAQLRMLRSRAMSKQHQGRCCVVAGQRGPTNRLIGRGRPTLEAAREAGGLIRR